MAPPGRQRRPLAATLQRSRGGLLVALVAVVVLGATRLHLPFLPHLFSPPSPSPSPLWRSPFLQQGLPLPLIHRPLTDYIQPDSRLPPALPPLLNPLAPRLSLQHHPFLHLLLRHQAPFQAGLLHDWVGATAFFEWLCPELTGAGGQGEQRGKDWSAEGGGQEEVSDDVRVRVCAAHLAREQQAEGHPGGVGTEPGGASGREKGSGGSGGVRAEGNEYAGYLPSVDVAYVELVDALEAVLRSHAHRHKHEREGGGRAAEEAGEGRFTFVSAGPLLHAMTAFAAAHAYSQLHPSQSMALVVVHPAMPKQLQALARLNAVTHFTLIPFPLGGGEVQEREPGRWVTVGDVLRRVARCDLLDIDADRAEKFAFDDPDAFAHVQRVVRRVQITTHGSDVHGKLEALFRLKGWLKAIDLPPAAAAHCQHPTRAFMMRPPSPHHPNDSSSHQPLTTSPRAPVPRPECVAHTPWGPVLLREGLLSFLNPSFAHQDDVVRQPLTPLPPMLL
ncbi:hypothetical protein CLOM_g13380 [Closterium sp. NIES-68]|nr:hypothetical protein CLOM_g7962 [Closterium sp. NIES-68]GJP54271.1 hypothetical protein CLOM_g13380 [Closterium sp. NIES-68]GJP72897.1 hypothetical protein CLOP_g3669 [Closterium sp. NIES-67]